MSDEQKNKTPLAEMTLNTLETLAFLLFIFAMGIVIGRFVW